MSEKIVDDWGDDPLALLWAFILAAKVPIAIGAIVGVLAGLVAAPLLPNSYTAASVLRNAPAANFVSLSTIMNGMPGDWHQMPGVATATHQAFLNELSDRARFEAFARSRRELFGEKTALIDDSLTLRRLFYKNLKIKTGKDTGDFVRLEFEYPEGVDGAKFLNEYVEDLISQTKNNIRSMGISTFAAAKTDRQNELLRLRNVRDLSAQQAIATYKNSFDTATAAGIEDPALASLGNTSLVVTANASLPMYFYGTKILTSEQQHAKDRIGNDLAIPEFATLSASINDIDRRMAVFKTLVVSPIFVSEEAVKTSPNSTRLITAALIGLVVALLVIIGSLFFQRFSFHNFPRSSARADRNSLALP